MPHRLTPRVTVLVVSVLFSVAFGWQALGHSSAPKAAERATPSPLVEPPGPAPHLALSAARPLPALRHPRTSPKREPKPKPKPKHRHIVAAPRPAPATAAPAPTATRRPTATPAPRPVVAPVPHYDPPVVAPAPHYVPPARTPAPTPEATPEPSGSFDTSGEP